MTTKTTFTDNTHHLEVLALHLDAAAARAEAMAAGLSVEVFGAPAARTRAKTTVARVAFVAADVD